MLAEICNTILSFLFNCVSVVQTKFHFTNFRTNTPPHTSRSRVMFSHAPDGIFAGDNLRENGPPNTNPEGQRDWLGNAQGTWHTFAIESVTYFLNTHKISYPTHFSSSGGSVPPPDSFLRLAVCFSNRQDYGAALLCSIAGANSSSINALRSRANILSSLFANDVRN